MFNAYLHLSDILNPFYLTMGFVITALLALVMERFKPRFWAAAIIAIILPFLIHLFCFFVFQVIRLLFPGYQTDLLFLYFDKDFFPFLIVYAVVWLFNFLARRYDHFVFIEVLLNILLLILIFWSQTSYRTTLYPHPSYFALSIIGFILCELTVLLMAGIKREKAGLNRKKIITGILSYLWIIIPLLLVFFLLTRNYQEESAKKLSGLMKPTLFQFDLAQYIRLESEIELSDDLVLLMRCDGAKKKYLLRRYLLSRYDPEQGFSRQDEPKLDEQPVYIPDYMLKLPDPLCRERQERKQEYYFLNFDTAAFVALNYPIQVIPYKNWPSSPFSRVYQVISKVRRGEEWEINSGAPTLWNDIIGLFGQSTLKQIKEANLSEELKKFYTFYAQDKEIADLALEITQGINGYYQKVEAVYKYLKLNYFYSLKPGIAEQGNQLHHFLFKSKKGYCSYFAFAMALLCRSLGIPARVAVGFYVGPESEVPSFYHSEELLNFYEVRAYQAHAWVEVYFNEFGWIEYDPTSTILAPGEDFPIIFANAGQEADLKKLIEEILENQKNLIPSQPWEQGQESASEGIKNYLYESLKVMLFHWYILLPACYLILILGLKYFPYIRFTLTKKKARKVRLLYAYSLNLIYGRGWVRIKNESLLEYAKRLQKEKGLEFVLFSEQCLKAVFSSRFNDQDYHKALSCYRDFITSWQVRLSLGFRLLALLNPKYLWRKKL
jgi:transglutaminase-like putative cysteine protease